MAIQTVQRKRPPLVRQSRSMSCWAAALEAWLAVCSPGTALDEGWALKAFSRWQAHDHRLEWSAFEVMARVLSMAWEEVDGACMTPAYFADRLGRGHLYMSYIPASGAVQAHVVVVYGLGPASIDLMDPEQGYLSRPFEFFTTRERAFVAWPAFGGGVIPDPEFRARQLLP